MKKKFLILILTLTLVLFPNVVANAAGLTISASSTSVTNGNKVRVTVNASGLAGKFSITSSNGSVLSGGTSSEWIENESKNYEFIAKGIGNATITVKALDVADSNGNTWSGNKSVTINVVKPREKSTNNNLKGLSVEGYEITPSFNKNTLEYTVNLDSNVESIKINATKEDGYASVSGAGDKEVALGDNKFEIKVTSETGKEKVYVLNAIVNDNNPITKSFNSKNYTVIKRKSSLTKPNDTFNESTIKIDEVDIPTLVNEDLGLTLIGMKDGNNAIYLFKVDESGNILGKYESLVSKNLTILFKDTTEEIDGYKKDSVTINEKEYDVYVGSNKDIVLIYGTNMETNNDNWYSYSISEKTIQLFDKEGYENNKKVLDDNDKELEQYKLIIYGLSGLSVLLLIITIIALLSKGKKKVKRVEVVKPVVKEEPVKEIKEEKVESKKEEISKKIEVDKKEEKQEEKETKKDIKKEKKNTKKVQEEIKQDDSIPSFEEIEKDLLNDAKKENDEEEDELVSVEDFLDLKRKKKRR